MLATLASSLPTWSHALVRVDAVTVVMALLVSFIGWVVVRYSKHYMAGDPRQREYNVRLLATVAAVFVVVITNNLAVLIAAWAATSLAMHGLLTFYGERPVAVAVAHKKFLLARAADVSMVGAAVAFVTAYGTLRIDGIVAAATVDGSLPTAARVGAVLLVVTAVLKCAQIPFHGWLIQVMEAPTPVSALLHAGVVNLGGLVLIRLAPLVAEVPLAMALLVVVGGLTAAIAALVMTTRISVKVMLAWSTCAQMGFMLMQCGLGLWEMALLHLVGHSLYKAHAFLSAGGVVRQSLVRQLAPAPAAPGAGASVLALLAAIGSTALVLLVFTQ
ncbi:MAG TPA: NADH-quinone oxidoreductase subunit L, partial [Acidimicrobiaceae bacterium]|nr:NADH-quinone oxidoreductase subunit L [Acidimicrobiaceae bacterium]